MRVMENNTERVNLATGRACIRLAIIADTHGVLDERIAAEVAACDAVLHAGDICGAHVLDELALLCGQVVAVAGNNDLNSPSGRQTSASLEPLPLTVRVELPGGHLTMEHGHRYGDSPSHDILRSNWPESRVIVYGHTHKQFWDRDSVPWVINPGAAGQTRTRGGASCAILTACKKSWMAEMKRFSGTDCRVA